MLKNELKYRIKEWCFPSAETCYTAQYRILGLWMYIDITLTGNFMRGGSTHCDTFEQAKKRVDMHRENMKRADYPVDTISTIIWEN